MEPRGVDSRLTAIPACNLSLGGESGGWSKSSCSGTPSDARRGGGRLRRVTLWEAEGVEVSTEQYVKGFFRGAGLCQVVVVAVCLGGCCLSGELAASFGAVNTAPQWWSKNFGLIFLAGAFLSLAVGVLSGFHAERVGSHPDKERKG